MTVNTNWTDPSTLDKAAGATLPSADLNKILSNLYMIGGATGKASASSATPCCRIYHDAAQSINSATITALAFNTERYDSDTMHDPSTSNSRISCRTAGKYHIGGCIQYATNATGQRFAMLRLNGTTNYLANNGGDAAATGESNVNVSCDWDMATTDYVELCAYQTTTAALNVNAQGLYSPEFWAHRIG